MRAKRLKKNHTPIDKSVLTFGAGKRDEDPKHLAWIRSLPCCVSGITGKTEAAHLRKGTDGKAGGKPSDKWVLPVNQTAHRRQHSCGEVTFWNEYGGVKKAKQLCMDLYAISGDTPKAISLLKKFRED